MKKVLLLAILVSFCLTVSIGEVLAADPITNMERGLQDAVINLKRRVEDKDRPVSGCDRVKRTVDRKAEDVGKWLGRRVEDLTR